MLRHQPILVLLLAIVLSLVGASNAAAEDESRGIGAAVLDFEGESVDAQLRETLTSILRNEVQQLPDHDVVNKFAVNFDDVLVVLGCNVESSTCLRQAAQQLKARVLVFGRLVRSDGALQVTVHVFDSATGRTKQTMVRTIAASDDPVVAFRREVAAFFAGQEASDTSVQIGSNVQGASIFIEGTNVGTAPFERKGLPPGRYQVEVRREGYQSWQGVLELQDGGSVKLWAPLVSMGGPADGAPASGSEPVADTAAPDVGVTSEPAEAEPNWGAWALLGAGGAATLASGIFFLQMTSVEDEIDDGVTSGSLSRVEYDDLVAQGESHETAHRIFLGVGLLGLAAGAVWLFGTDQDAAQTRLVPTPQGVAVRF